VSTGGVAVVCTKDGGALGAVLNGKLRFLGMKAILKDQEENILGTSGDLFRAEDNALTKEVEVSCSWELLLLRSWRIW
jgi:hypothetical protein